MRETGLTKALDLDARALELAERTAEDVQLALFEGSSVFGTLRVEGQRIVPNGRGRPRGSVNRTTADMVKLIQSTGRHPLLAMAEIVATPINVIAETLGCTMLEAATYHRQVMSDLAPYVAQRMPLALQVEGANAGTLNLVINAVAGAAAGLGMTLADEAHIIGNDEETQGKSDA